MRSTAFILISLAVPLFAAPPIPAGGTDLSNSASEISARAEGAGRVEKIRVSGQGFSEATRVSLTTDDLGRISWQGYKGTYRVRADDKETEPSHPGSTGSAAKVSLP